MSEATPTVDLSIDFDFFIREDPMWDLGHSEWHPHIQHALWMSRYRSIPLHDETDPARFADFVPAAEVLIRELAARGIRIPSGIRSLRVAESHVEAKQFFCGQKIPADYLVNIDAHHDAFTTAEDELSCENWLAHTAAIVERRSWPTRVIQVYPTWKNPRGDRRPMADITVEKWPTFAIPTGAFVRNVFLCRSGGWVPPHHDPAFETLAVGLAKRSHRVLGLVPHPRAHPSAEIAKTWRDALQHEIGAPAGAFSALSA
jgi:hypothetical protein